MSLDFSQSSRGTIVALASAPGRAGVAVVRISGEGASQTLLQICHPALYPEARKATLRDIVDYRTGELIDHALVLFFPAPNSFTGEDVVELHLHGGRAILSAVLDVLCSLKGYRIAEPGAYSRRAFENGKMDLTEAEAVADLVEAETAAQRRQALRQMDGALGQLYSNWADRLKQRLAFVEAEIDFADEELPPEIEAQRLDDVRHLEREIEAHLHDGHRGERLRDGFTIALLGAPNAGKSSLLNALARREAAIVAPTPGTTRDVIEVQLDIGGYPVMIADTAGLRESADHIETEGVRRALARAEQADLKLLIFDGLDWPNKNPETAQLIDDQAIIVVNKSDLMDDRKKQALAEQEILAISAKAGEGLSDLTALLIHELDTRFVASSAPALTRARHRASLEETLQHLKSALIAPQVELSAEDLRMAIRSLGRITGRVDVEDLLDVIFSSFCIGK